MSERSLLSASLHALLLGIPLLLAACGGGGGGGGDSGRDNGGGGGGTSILAAEQWQLELNEGSRGTCDLRLALRRDGSIRGDGTLRYRRTDGGQVDRYEVSDATVTVNQAARQVTVEADNVAFSGGELPEPGARVLTFTTTWSLTQLTGYFSINDESSSRRFGVRAHKEGGTGVTDAASSAGRVSESDTDLSADDPELSEGLPTAGEDPP